MCVGSDEPFSAATSVQQRKCATHSQPHHKGVCWFLGRPWRCTSSTPTGRVRKLTESSAHNVYRRPPEATTLFLHNSKGFHDTNIRSHTAGKAASPQPHMAAPEIWTKGRVRARCTLFKGALFHKSRAAAGIHASSPEGDGPGLCTIILAGGRSGGHQAAAMCAVRRLGPAGCLVTHRYDRLFILPCP